MSAALDQLKALEEDYRRYRDLFDSAPVGYLITNLSGVIREVNRAACKMLNAQHLIGKPVKVYFRHDNVQNLINRILEPSSGEAVEWEGLLHPRHRTPFYASVNITAIRDTRGNTLELRWMLRDISHYKAIEEEIRTLNAHLEARVRERTGLLELEQRLRNEALARERNARIEAEILRDLGNILNSTLELSEVFRHILDNVGRVVPHDAADLMVIEDDMAQLALCRGYNHCGDNDYLSSLRFAVMETPPLSDMARTGEPFISPQLTHYPEWIKALGHSNTVRAFVGVPIRMQGETVGFLNLTSAIPDFFTQEHVKLLQAFSAQAAVAIQNARLHRQAKAIAVLEERQRLARDLHDAVSQSLFTSSLIADSLARLMKTKAVELPEHLDYLRRLNRGALAEMRNLLLELRPAHLVDINLPSQLHQFVDAIRGRKNTQVSLSVEDGEPMPNEIQVALYRIAQEAFNNIIKHSRATEVQIALYNNNERVELSIQDNGRGFTPGQQQRGMGLSTMRERATDIHATFELNSRKNGGTSLTVIWRRQEQKL